MTPQELFNASVGGLLAQGELAHTDCGCQYLDRDSGNRCAVGILLSPKAANRWADFTQESFGINSLWYGGELTIRQREEAVADLLTLGIDVTEEAMQDTLVGLQICHDNAQDFDDFRARAESYAYRHHLTWTFDMETAR